MEKTYQVVVCLECNHAFATQRVLLLGDGCCSCHSALRYSLLCNVNHSAQFTKREAQYAVNLINGNLETKT